MVQATRLALVLGIVLVLTATVGLSGVAAAQDVDDVFECTLFLSEDEVEEGEPFEIVLTVEYTGDDEWDLHFRVIDSENHFEQTSTVLFTENDDVYNFHIEEFNHDHDAGTEGEIIAELNEEEGGIDVPDEWVECASEGYKVVEEEVVEEGLDVGITDTNSPVTEGETLSVTADVENVGEELEEQEISLDIDGDKVDSADAEVVAGATETVTLNWDTEEGDEGSYTATVSSEDDSDSTTVEVGEPDEPEPAFFSVDSVDMADEVTAGDELVVSAEVRNTGEESDTQDVELYVEGGNSVVDSERVALGAGESRSVELSWDVDSDAEGEYDVLVRTDDDSMGQLVYVEALPNLEIDEIRTVQVVFNANVTGDDYLDLVEGKETAVLIYPDGDNLEELDESVEIEVDGPWDTLRKQVSPDEYRAAVGGDEDDYLKLTGFPEPEGHYTVSATLDPRNVIDEADRRGNTGVQTVNVLNTREQSFGYYSLSKESVYPSPDEGDYRDHINYSNEFILATYPIAEEDYHTLDEGDFSASGGLTRSLVKLDAVRLLHRHDRAVSVTHEDFFDGTGLKGYATPTLKSVLVNEGHYKTTAHEIGHTYGLYTDTERYNLRPRSMGSEGYWVAGNQYVHEITGLRSFMSNFTSHGVRVPGFWVENREVNGKEFKDYDALFEELLDSDVEPLGMTSSSERDVLIVSGLVYKNRTVEPLNWYYSENRSELEEMRGDDMKLMGYNYDGDVVFSDEFGTPFEALVSGDGVESPVDIDLSGFTTDVEYSPGLAEVRVVEDGGVLEVFNPHSTLLHQSIDLVPDHGFEGEDLSDERRNALHNKVDALENMIENENFVGAVNKIEKDIQPALDRWLEDGYNVEYVQHISKNGVMDTSQAVANRLRLQIEPKNRPECLLEQSEGINSSGEVPGYAYGLDVCPPGQQETHPGRGVGPDGTPPGHGGEVPGKESGSGQGQGGGSSGSSPSNGR